MDIDTLASILKSLTDLREQTTNPLGMNPEITEKIDVALDKTLDTYITDDFFDEFDDDTSVTT